MPYTEECAATFHPMETTDTERDGSWLPLSGHILFASIRWKRINECELQKSIQILGGKLETFFSHEITCVLTDELTLPAKRDDKLLKRNQQGVLLNQQPKCNSIIDKAKSLGIQVMRIETFLTWLRLHINMPSKTQAPKKPTKKNSITKLNGCFMKIENQSQNFSPVFKVYSSEPEVEFERLYYQPNENSNTNCASCSSSSKSEFSVDIKLPKLLKTGENQQCLHNKSTSVSESSSEPPKNNHNKGKRHYCECCKMYFSCLSMHLKGPQHTKYVSNNDHFKQLAALTGGMTSVTEFREKLSNISTSPLEVKPDVHSISAFTSSLASAKAPVEKLCNVSTSALEVKPKPDVHSISDFLRERNNNCGTEFMDKMCNRAATLEIKPEVSCSADENQSKPALCKSLTILMDVKPEIMSNFDESEFKGNQDHSLTTAAEVKLEIDGYPNASGENEPAEFEEKLLEIIKCKNLSSEPLTEILNIEDFEYLNSEKSELGRIFSQTYPSTDEFPASETFSDKTLLKDELNFNDLFPSGMLPDNDRLFSSDLSDNESIQENVQNIINNVFDENPLTDNGALISDSVEEEVKETLNSLCSILTDDVRTSEPSVRKRQVLRNLCFESWSIRPISDFKMLFIRCSVLEAPRNFPPNTWTAKSVTDTKLVLTKLGFGVNGVSA